MSFVSNPCSGLEFENCLAKICVTKLDKTVKKHECSIHVLNANIKVMESLGVILCVSVIKEASK